MVMGDRDIVLTIFRNLLSNSIKFTEKGGKIDMDCTVMDDKRIFFIRDNGVGISEDKQKKIFSSTEKISERGTFNEIGSGLGLILIKDLAVENGGDLWFDSIEGEGTTFYVSFIR
jgi:two-component system sensor histidine kinase/response regulator